MYIYICIYMYIYIYVYVYICIYIYICIYVCISCIIVGVGYWSWLSNIIVISKMDRLFCVLNPPWRWFYHHYPIDVWTDINRNPRKICPNHSHDTFLSVRYRIPSHRFSHHLPREKIDVSIWHRGIPQGFQDLAR